MTDILTTTDAAAMLNISRQRIRALIANGRLPAQRIGPAGRGGEWLLAREDVEAFAALPRRTGRPAHKEA